MENLKERERIIELIKKCLLNILDNKVSGYRSIGVLSLCVELVFVNSPKTMRFNTVVARLWLKEQLGWLAGWKHCMLLLLHFYNIALASHVYLLKLIPVPSSLQDDLIGADGTQHLQEDLSAAQNVDDHLTKSAEPKTTATSTKPIKAKMDIYTVLNMLMRFQRKVNPETQ